jgi:hypothetical protein
MANWSGNTMIVEFKNKKTNLIILDLILLVHEPQDVFLL